MAKNYGGASIDLKGYMVFLGKSEKKCTAHKLPLCQENSS